MTSLDQWWVFRMVHGLSLGVDALWVVHSVHRLNDYSTDGPWHGP